MNDCRVVAVEWDRGHETIDGILRSEGGEGIIITEVRDLVPDSGYCWLRSDEVLNVEDYCESSGQTRIATLRNARSEHLDAELSDLRVLLRRLVESNAMIGMYARRTGSDELAAGLLSGIDGTAVTYREVDPRGVLTGERISVPIDEIIRVDWDTGYLGTLQSLVDLGPPQEH